MLRLRRRGPNRCSGRARTQRRRALRRHLNDGGGLGKGPATPTQRTAGGAAMRRLAQAQGVFNVVSGVWPLVSMRTFEAVYGPKSDRWLVHTVAGLLTTVGCAQLLSRDPVQLRAARVVGIGTAATRVTIDAIYVPKGGGALLSYPGVRSA